MVIIKRGESSSRRGKKVAAEGESSSRRANKMAAEGESSSRRAKKVAADAESSSRRAKKVAADAESSSRRAKKVAADAERKRKLLKMTTATIQIVKDRAAKRKNRCKPGNEVKYFDQTQRGYEWLLPGWIAEERFVASGNGGLGRIYRFYYDPAGRKYNTIGEVEHAWAMAGLICIKD